MTDAPEKALRAPDIARIEELARAATAGPYRAATFQIYAGRESVAHTGMGQRGPAKSHLAVADAAYFAALDPATVLAICKRLTTAEADLATARAQRDRLAEMVEWLRSEPTTIDNDIDDPDYKKWSDAAPDHYEETFSLSQEIAAHAEAQKGEEGKS